MKSSDIEVGSTYIETDRSMYRSPRDIYRVLQVLSQSEKAQWLRDRDKRVRSRYRGTDHSYTTVQVEVIGRFSQRSGYSEHDEPRETWVTPQKVDHPFDPGEEQAKWETRQRQREEEKQLRIATAEDLNRRLDALGLDELKMKVYGDGSISEPKLHLSTIKSIVEKVEEKL